MMKASQLSAFEYEYKAYSDEDPFTRTYYQRFGAPFARHLLYNGYQYLGAAKDQVASGYVIPAWPDHQKEDPTAHDGSMIATSILDPPGVPLVTDMAQGGSTTVKTWWTNVGHLKGGKGWSFIKQWHETGSEDGPDGMRIIRGQLAGSNHGYLDGHVEWVIPEDMAKIRAKASGGIWKPGPKKED